MSCVIDRAEREHAHEEGEMAILTERIATRVSELTAKGAEYYPYCREHIMAFFGDMLAHQEKVLTAAIETPGVDFTGLLRRWIGMYYENLAEKQAIRELEQEHETQDY